MGFCSFLFIALFFSSKTLKNQGLTGCYPVLWWVSDAFLRHFHQTWDVVTTDCLPLKPFVSVSRQRGQQVQASYLADTPSHIISCKQSPACLSRLSASILQKRKYSHAVFLLASRLWREDLVNVLKTNVVDNTSPWGKVQTLFWHAQRNIAEVMSTSVNCFPKLLSMWVRAAYWGRWSAAVLRGPNVPLRDVFGRRV